MGFPFREAAPKITLNPGRRLISLLDGLGEQLHRDCRDSDRDTLQSLAGYCWLSCDMTVHPFHRIGCRERKAAGQYFVKRDSKSVQVAAGINGWVYSCR